MNFTMTKIAAALVLTVAAAGAQAAIVTSTGVFQMDETRGLDMDGLQTSLTGSQVNTDATLTGFVDQAGSTWGVSSTTKFFGKVWTASNGVLISTAGSYSLDTATGVLSSIASPVVAADGKLQFTVGVGQVGGTIDFAWGTTTGIKVVNVWDVEANGSMTSLIAPGMENGPFPDYNAFFTLSTPGLAVGAVPEASTYGMMLAGLGLVGFAVRRRKLVA